jgi:hypothetical protein
VKKPFASSNLSDTLRRRAELATAVAQERLLSTHVEHALELIELVGDKVPFENALSMYARLLRLTEEETRTITTRALAILGERAARSDTWPELITEAQAAAQEKANRRQQGLFGGLRQRLRGRVNEDLRHWVELTAASTEVALLEAHVSNALGFVRLTEKELPFAAAVETYLDLMEVRDGIAEVVYYITLARLAEEQLPSRAARRVPPEPALAGTTEPRRLRVVEGEAG